MVSAARLREAFEPRYEAVARELRSLVAAAKARGDAGEVRRLNSMLSDIEATLEEMRQVKR
jgi:hypothetical protein